jgi:tellurite resistance protein
VQAAISQPVALAMRKAHPARVARRAFGPDNPLMRGVAGMAAKVVEARKPAATTNPYLALEKWWTDGVIQAFDAWRDWRDTMFEATFLSIYGSPLMEALAEAHAFKRTLKDPKELRFLPEVQAILLGVRRGGFAEAVIRMLILLAEARGSVRRDRLERSAKVLSKDEPFAALGPERRALLIREQSIIVEFDADGAIATLPDMLPDAQQREQAIAVVEFIAGAVEEMEPHTIQTLQRMRAALGLAALGLPDSAKDPLKRIDPLPDAAE